MNIINTEFLQIGWLRLKETCQLFTTFMHLITMIEPLEVIEFSLNNARCHNELVSGELISNHNRLTCTVTGDRPALLQCNT